MHGRTSGTIVARNGRDIPAEFVERGPARVAVESFLARAVNLSPAVTALISLGTGRAYKSRESVDRAIRFIWSHGAAAPPPIAEEHVSQGDASTPRRSASSVVVVDHLRPQEMVNSDNFDWLDRGQVLAGLRAHAL